MLKEHSAFQGAFTQCWTTREVYKWRAKMIFVRPARKKWAGGVVPLPEILVDRVVPLSKIRIFESGRSPSSPNARRGRTPLATEANL